MEKLLACVALTTLLAGCASYGDRETCTIRENATGGFTEACGTYGNTYYRKNAMGNYVRSPSIFERSAYSREFRHNWGPKKDRGYHHHGYRPNVDTYRHGYRPK